MPASRICAAVAALALSASALAPRAFAQPAASGNAPGAGADDSKEEVAQEREDDAQHETKPLELDTSAVVRANLETSYLVYPYGINGLRPLLFECSLAPAFFLHLPNWPVAVVLTPKIVLRMLNEESTPVDSPSFMPRISIYGWIQPKVTGKPTLYGSLTLSHHSNGQAGPFLLPDGSINHDDGSFSTNFFEFAMYLTGFRGKFFGWSSLAMQWHPGFNQDPELRGRYGLLRLHLASTLVADLPLQGQVSIRLSMILDKFQHTSKSPAFRALERFPLSISYSMTLPGLDLGLFAGYYLGHDYYNIFFDKVVHAFQIGISGGLAAGSLSPE